MCQIAADARSSLISLDGTDIHYLDVGDGPPLLLVHGLGHSIVSWHRNIDALSAHRRVLALDLPGHGLSGCPREAAYDPPYFAGIVQRFIQELELAQVDAVGCSAGGLSILLAALASPNSFRRLVLVDSAGFTTFPSDPVGRVMLQALLWWRSLPRPRQLIRAAYAAGFFDRSIADEETIADLYGRRHHDASRVAARKMIAAFFTYSQRLATLHERLRTLEIPVLVVWGANDRMFPVRDTQIARRVLQRPRIEWLQRCGHCPQLERPRDFNALVLEFLNAS
ncbi:MAG: alpha/beta fold hydrolase [Candidatus Eremiobacteraeota bacterium]|nr:alpha/beta fold hydrolase [Candidatus Eremiobacteraeota bacterium]